MTLFCDSDRKRLVAESLEAAQSSICKVTSFWGEKQKHVVSGKVILLVKICSRCSLVSFFTHDMNVSFKNISTNTEIIPLSWFIILLWFIQRSICPFQKLLTFSPVFIAKGESSKFHHKSNPNIPFVIQCKWLSKTKPSTIRFSARLLLLKVLQFSHVFSK